MTAEPEWVADPHLSWNILLTARMRDRPDPVEVLSRLEALCSAHGWAPPDPPRSDLPLAESLADLASRTLASRVAVHLADQDVVIGAHHGAVDGLGLLAVLHEVTGTAVATTARGLAERPAASALRSAMLRRLGEVAFRPPARVLPSAPGSGSSGDVFAERVLPGTFRTADLVYAGVVGVTSYNEGRGGSTRRPAVAIGASRSGGMVLEVANDSALIRLRDLTGASVDEIRQLVRSAPVEPEVEGASAAGRVIGIAVGALAPRLGSTLLVSHLGEVTAPGVEALSFLPVTGGGSGVSLGAVGLAGSTCLTLRARGRQHTTDGLEELLEAVCAVLVTG